ncbi:MULTISPECIES: type II toxin-antitoxin system Phd/YefM family antitoxin [unclassified Sphingomonas]|jgi:prevent-host-death family protein|uniref:type II toxin-antitoxin system Phd/YefM family antitoxin n=1 Tax=unclassified Sphingomonas TaxID=196159 RepID=UPI000E106CAD|nr:MULTISPECIES: type II toxin-antitoxin system prevent-host-death family antitoxin [unclassified Sphingomonas]AXJ95070.1 type II toxin-antitoxin system prevent-host-death family antitoxin [Sphingomonas sp. FARSPH]
MAEVDPQKTFNVHEAKTQFSKLIDRAHAGEEIIVAKAGVPYAKLVPIEPPAKRRRVPGGWKDLGPIPDSVWFDPLPEDELDLWEGKRLDKFGL